MRAHTLAELAKHNKPDDIWIIVHSKAYNVSKYFRGPPRRRHHSPRGRREDATEEFEEIGHSVEASGVLVKLCIGHLPKEVRIPCFPFSYKLKLTLLWNQEHAEAVQTYRPTFEASSQTAAVVTHDYESSTSTKGPIGRLIGAIVMVGVSRAASARASGSSRLTLRPCVKSTTSISIFRCLAPHSLAADSGGTSAWRPWSRCRLAWASSHGSGVSSTCRASLLTMFLTARPARTGAWAPLAPKPRVLST